MLILSPPTPLRVKVWRIRVWSGKRSICHPACKASFFSTPLPSSYLLTAAFSPPFSISLMLSFIQGLNCVLRRSLAMKGRTILSAWDSHTQFFSYGYESMKGGALLAFLIIASSHTRIHNLCDDEVIHAFWVDTRKGSSSRLKNVRVQLRGIGKG